MGILCIESALTINGIYTKLTLVKRRREGNKMSEEIKNKVENDESLDMVSFGIIANAGDARSFAFQALDAAKHGNFEEADELMKRSEEAGTLAHKAQTDLLFKEMNGEHTEVNVLLVHSQDHLMTSMLAQELIKELIELYKNK